MYYSKNVYSEMDFITSNFQRTENFTECFNSKIFLAIHEILFLSWISFILPLKFRIIAMNLIIK